MNCQIISRSLFLREEEELFNPYKEPPSEWILYEGSLSYKKPSFGVFFKKQKEYSSFIKTNSNQTPLGLQFSLGLDYFRKNRSLE